ncbi:hypothetical protein [uncultured Duncaniella sp.]|uniref:hypothetical protein n=1 Tax=uncultured Duncaniella sp. TaxID=2768039 RepID=UPI002615F12D|nr:hypothetical protein [uncultured Duncaniella sp.]
MAHIVTKCDFCDDPAIYDAKTILGPWAFVCNKHYNMYCSHMPGLSKRLEPIMPTEAASKVCRICGKKKPINEFYKFTDRHGQERYRTECIECNLKRKADKRRVNNGG